MDKKNMIDQDELKNVTGGAAKGSAPRSVSAATNVATGRKVSDSNVAVGNNSVVEPQFMKVCCPYCGDIFQADVQKSIIKCPTCHKEFEIKG